MIEFNASTDFGQVVDALEAVTLVRRGCNESVSIPSAWRFLSEVVEVEPTQGAVTVYDTHWHLAWDEVPAAPRVGDVVRDSAGDCWTILKVERPLGKTRWLCHTRELRIANGLRDRVDLQQAVWQDLGSGPEVVSWQTIRPAVAARIQPQQTTIDRDAEPLVSTTTYRVLLEESPSLDHNHRIVATDGTVYKMVGFEQAARIDVLPVAIVQLRVTGDA